MKGENHISSHPAVYKLTFIHPGTLFLPKEIRKGLYQVFFETCWCTQEQPVICPLHKYQFAHRLRGELHHHNKNASIQAIDAVGEVFAEQYSVQNIFRNPSPPQLNINISIYNKTSSSPSSPPRSCSKYPSSKSPSSCLMAFWVAEERLSDSGGCEEWLA